MTNSRAGLHWIGNAAQCLVSREAAIDTVEFCGVDQLSNAILLFPFVHLRVTIKSQTNLVALMRQPPPGTRNQIIGCP